MNDYIIIGKIIKAQGIKGELKIYPETNDPKRFYDLKEIYISKNKPFSNLFETEKIKKLDIEKIRINNNMVFLKTDDINNRNEAEGLKNYYVIIPSNLRIDLKENEYFIDDIIGCNVYDEKNNLIGIINDVITSLSNDIYVISRKDDKELLIPAVKDIVKFIDIKNKRININLMEGLLE